MTPSPTPGRLRVAVVGAGPSGVYTASAIAKKMPGALVDVLDKLPAPYGLVRYGVAPDHEKMKSVVTTLSRPFQAGQVRFLGNVEVGRDVGLHELRPFYHAIVFATGCGLDRDLDLPGSHLEGNLGSADVVGWYSAHVDRHDCPPRLDHPGVAVVGGGNVALDVARVLAKAPGEFVSTDMPDPALRALAGSAVADIHVIVRRGPADAGFTPAELLQIGSLANADVVVHDDGALSRDYGGQPLSKRQQENLRLLAGWTQPAPPGARRTIHLRFLRAPVELVGDQRVEGIVLRKNVLAPDGTVQGTGERERLDVGLVVRAIGYRSAPIAGLPFDETSGTVPNDHGRVLRDGLPVPATYVAGWVKRGPSGVIGTNMADASDTVASLLADRAGFPEPPFGEPAAVTAFLAGRGVRYVDWNAWTRLDDAEQALGALRGARRVKVAGREAMLDTIFAS
jgi:ferredoxin/flavodoxin---NADP+ reductase